MTFDITDLVLAVVCTAVGMAIILWLRQRRWAKDYQDLSDYAQERIDYAQERIDYEANECGKAYLDRARRGYMLHEAYGWLEREHCPALHAQIERELDLTSTCTHHFLPLLKLDGRDPGGICRWCDLKVTPAEMKAHGQEQ